MNNDNIIDLISDSDDDFDQQPASTSTRFGQNGEGRGIISFEDEDWQRGAPAPSSSRHIHNNNGQYRTLPPSLTNGRPTESARYTFGSGDMTRPHPSYMALRHDSARGLSASNSVDSVGEKHASSAADANENNKRVLPSSFSNGNTSKSMLANVASATRKLPPLSTDRNSQSLRENRMGTNMTNGNVHPSSSRMAIGSFNAGNTQRENDDDDVIVYGGPSSHRVLPSSFGASNSNNSEVNGFGAQGRLNPENRILDSDERAVYREALQHISRDKGEDDLPEGVLTVPLLKHQKMALAWMVSKENSSHCAGGILADDQGLGKTVSTIALIQKERSQQSKFMSVDSDRLKSEALNLDEDDEGEQTVNDEPKKDQGAISLLTAAGTSSVEPCASQPNNVPDKMDESKAERKKKAKACTSSVSTTRSMTRPAAGTLVVCPASVLKQWASELTDKVSESAKLSVLVYHGGLRTKDPSELAKYDVVVTTYTIVANEVPKQIADDDDQKNSAEPSAGHKRKRPSSAKSKSKKKKKRLDSDFDLDSGPIARVRWFRVVLDEAQTIKNYRTVVARACCGLRAKRRWCLSGTPIQNAIDELFSYFRFLKYDPYSTFNSFCTMIKHPIARDAVLGYKKLQAVLRVVLLRRTKETLINGVPIINLPPKTINLNKVDFSHEERSFYLTLEERSRQQFKAFAAAGTLKQNYANILLMLLRLRQACDHPLLVKGNQSEYGGDGSIEMAKQLPKEVVIDLLAKVEVGSALCTLCNDPPEDAVVTICGHVFCYQCIHERITTDENMCPAPNCSKTLSLESLFSSGALRICISGKSSSAGASSSADNESSSISQSSYVSSKIQAAIDILNSIINTDALTESDTMESNQSRVAPAKAIVFSQWTGMLDLLELSLNTNLIQYRRLDGTMSLNLRDKAVKDFNTDPEVRVMIMSLKAGNLGLNMVAACHVILLDLWWNPYAEDQAVDRAHRIGQTRPVTVSRLTVKDTVEDRILALQEEKRAMVSSAFGEDKSGGHTTRLTVEDLWYLFKI
ncbi:putative ATP-dependent helicase C17A2.12-like isoform X1 [Panicum miliaceum]|uniref:ATP-dependent helicase C17A2.12-like isoform X1 n=1 Tax=Panicum miliaceum TaxID=4540 RepID=A0A3L6TDF4_PANMI|nr:putative ATP-dependent helicase C17A2.12-like isoform X1 [Panicum miliaceum]